MFALRAREVVVVVHSVVYAAPLIYGAACAAVRGAARYGRAAVLRVPRAAKEWHTRVPAKRAKAHVYMRMRERDARRCQCVHILLQVAQERAVDDFSACCRYARYAFCRRDDIFAARPPDAATLLPLPDAAASFRPLTLRHYRTFAAKTRLRFIYTLLP